MKAIFPTVAAVLLLAATACNPADAPAPEGEQDLAAQEEYEEDMEAGAEPSAPTVLGFNETHEFDDGLAVSLGDFERWDAGAAGYDDATYTVFTVTFDNGEEEPVALDTIGFSCNVAGVEGSYEAFEEFAYEWPAMVQPGESGIWQPACEMAPDQTELQVMMEINTQTPVHFAGEVE